MLQPGNSVPNFSLPNQDGKIIDFYELLHSGPVVIFFYPKAGTWGCTIESCSFRDSHDEFLSLNATVIGISGDPVQNLKIFSEERRLPFHLLSDIDFKVHELFGINSFLGFRRTRSTFIAYPDKKIHFAYSAMLSFVKHVEKTRAFLKEHLV